MALLCLGCQGTGSARLMWADPAEMAPAAAVSGHDTRSGLVDCSPVSLGSCTWGQMRLVLLPSCIGWSINLAWHCMFASCPGGMRLHSFFALCVQTCFWLRVQPSARHGLELGLSVPLSQAPAFAWQQRCRTTRFAGSVAVSKCEAWQGRQQASAPAPKQPIRGPAVAWASVVAAISRHSEEGHTQAASHGGLAAACLLRR